MLVASCAALASPIEFNRQGVMAWDVGPPTSFWWPKDGGSMKVFESARYCRANHTYWPPNEQTHELTPYSLNHSYFRVRDMESGVVIGNVQGD
jgi:hypothetical protein